MSDSDFLQSPRPRSDEKKTHVDEDSATSFQVLDWQTGGGERVVSYSVDRHRGRREPGHYHVTDGFEFEASPRGISSEPRVERVPFRVCSLVERRIDLDGETRAHGLWNRGNQDRDSWNFCSEVENGWEEPRIVTWCFWKADKWTKLRALGIILCATTGTLASSSLPQPCNSPFLLNDKLEKIKRSSGPCVSDSNRVTVRALSGGEESRINLEKSRLETRPILQEEIGR